MRRRRLLTVVGGSAVTPSIAGCLGSDDNGDDDGSNGDADGDDDEFSDGNDDSDDADGGSNGDGDTTALIESADSTLDEAVDEFQVALDETDDPLSDSSHSIDVESIEAHIVSARDDLSAARDGATDAQLETIDALETLADFIDDFVSVFSALGDAMNEFESWGQNLDRERWDDAVEAAERAVTYNQDAMDSLEVARSTFDDLDADALDDLSAVERAELVSELEAIDETLDVLDVFFVSGGEMAEAMIPFENGTTALDTFQFETAATEFSAAEDQFQVAHTTVTDAEAEASEEYRSDLSELACEFDALSDVAGYFSDGAKAYANGDTATGDAYFAEADTASQQCGRGGVRLSFV